MKSKGEERRRRGEMGRGEERRGGEGRRGEEKERKRNKPTKNHHQESVLRRGMK